MPVSKYLWLIVYLLLHISSHGQNNEIVNRSFSKIKWNTQTKSYTLKNKYGKKWKLRVTFPEKSTNKVPLILALHWAGGGDTFQIFHDCLALPGVEKLNAIVVSPEGDQQSWNTENNINKVFDIIEFAKSNWNIDGNKIVVIGYSNGANGSWYHAENNPHLFSAAIPMAGYYAPKKKIEIPIYAIHGANDELFPLSNMKEWIHNSKEKGSNIVFSINKNLSHFEGCKYVAELQKAVDWVQKTVWTDETH